jgi:DNA mismatch endonuclease, patch repair protein
MSCVSQRDTGPEMKLRRTLHRIGLRYRLHDSKLPGTPDIVFPRFNAVIFVHGCFWHAHKGCKLSTKPSSRKGYWHEKFQANEKRDKRNYAALAEKGWRVLVVWECAIKFLKKADASEQLGFLVLKWLKSDIIYTEIGKKHSQTHH